MCSSEGEFTSVGRLSREICGEKWIWELCWKPRVFVEIGWRYTWEKQDDICVFVKTDVSCKINGKIIFFVSVLLRRRLTGCWVFQKQVFTLVIWWATALKEVYIIIVAKIWYFTEFERLVRRWTKFSRNTFYRQSDYVPVN